MKTIEVVKMKNFYLKMSPGVKRSIIFSMKTLIREFLSPYKGNLDTFQTIDDLLNDLYFYWLRQSGENNYIWCNSTNIDVFSNEFTFEMKKILRSYLCEYFVSEILSEKKAVKKEIKYRYSNKL